MTAEKTGFHGMGCGKDQSRALLTIVKTDAEGNMLPVHTKVCGLAENKLSLRSLRR